jgi:hypothetical protein
MLFEGIIALREISHNIDQSRYALILTKRVKSSQSGFLLTEFTTVCALKDCSKLCSAPFSSRYKWGPSRPKHDIHLYAIAYILYEELIKTLEYHVYIQNIITDSSVTTNKKALNPLPTYTARTESELKNPLFPKTLVMIYFT